MQNRPASVLAVGALFLAVFVCSFLGRAADDNTLFSWAWVFAGMDAPRIYLLLIAGLVLAFVVSKFGIPEHYEQLFLASVSFAACLPFWRESEIIVDASRYFTQAKHLELYGIAYFLKEWGKSILAWTDLPLVPFLYGLILKLSGESRSAIQLFTSALFALTTVITCRIGKNLWNRETGFLAGLLLLGIPYLLTQTPLLLVDVPTMFFLALALHTFILVMQKGGALRIASAAVAFALAVLSKYSTWFMLSILGVVLVVCVFRRDGQGGRVPLLRGAAVLAAGALLSGGALLSKYEVIAEQLRLLREYQKPGLGRWGESLPSTFLFQIHPFISLSALVAAVVAVRKRDAKFAILCWPFLLILAFNIRRIRYTLPVFPLLTLMAAYGLQLVKRDDLRRFISFGIVATSLVVAVFAYLPFSDTMSSANLMRAGRYLNTLKQERIEVITVPSAEPIANPAVAVPLLDLFTDKRLLYHYRPEGFPSPEEVGSSSLRFTWEYRNPPYYTSPSASTPERAPLAVLSDLSPAPPAKTLELRLSGRRLASEFSGSEKIFRSQTVVRIYTVPEHGPTKVRN